MTNVLAGYKVGAREVRQWYRNQNYEAHISRDGHIKFRLLNAAPGTPWLDGRWVSEYCVDRDGRMYHA